MDLFRISYIQPFVASQVAGLCPAEQRPGRQRRPPQRQLRRRGRRRHQQRRLGAPGGPKAVGGADAKAPSAAGLQAVQLVAAVLRPPKG